MEDAIDYALRYGGRCRDCADAKIDGVCDITGTPCNPRVFRSAIEHALRAWRYGIEHGFIVSPLAHAKDGCAAKDARIAELEAENNDLKDSLGDLEGVIAHSDAIIAMSEKVELENEALKARVSELRAVLKPFSDMALRWDDIPPRKYFGDTDFELFHPDSTEVTLPIKLLRAARAALQGGQDNG